MKTTLAKVIPHGVAAARALRALPGVYARTLTAQSSTDTRRAEPIFLYCESTSATESALQVLGWAVARSGVQAVEVFVDGMPVGPVEYGISRPDLAASYPELLGSDRGGFAVEIPLTRLAGAPARRLHIVARSVAGASAEYVQEVSAPTGEATEIPESQAAAQDRIPERYCLRLPSPQNAVDIFAGEWTSRLPAELAKVRAGSTALFEDPRVTWGIEALGGVRGKTAIELGPLEGGHTYMLERAGAELIVAIEANTHAYLKCLVTKELLGLRRAEFLCGDFVEYLRTCDSPFDLCVAVGVLYHMSNPVELLSLIAGVTDALLLWTHYYDHAIISARPELAVSFSDTRIAEHAGLTHTLHQLEYGGTREAATFLGGKAEYSCWLERADILSALELFGFTEHAIAFDMPDHPNGPCFALAASKKPRLARAAGS